MKHATAGRRSSLITIEAPTRAANASNEIELTWSSHCQTWAAVEPVNGSEHSLTAAQQNLAEVVYRVDTLATPETVRITPGMRFVWVGPYGVQKTLYFGSALVSSDPASVQYLAQERPPV